MITETKLFREQIKISIKQKLDELNIFLSLKLWGGISAIIAIIVAITTYTMSSSSENHQAASSPLIDVSPALSAPSVDQDNTEVIHILEGARNHSKTSQKPIGDIKVPVNGSVVAYQFIANGKIYLPKNEYGWLAVKKGNSYWPKAPHIKTTNDDWRINVHEGGPPGKFNLVLFSVRKSTHENILNWFKEGNLSGSYPAMMLGNEIRVLDEIKLSVSGR